MIKIFDTHAHCDDERIKNGFLGGVDAFIEHQFENGVGAIVNIGTNLENSRASIELAKKFDNVYASCGIHPYDIRFYDNVEKTLLELKAMLSCEGVVALGEIGLDYHYEDIDKEKQMVFFRAQMSLAKELGIPVIIHDRDAHGDCMDVIRDFPEVTGIFHSFSGSAEMARELVSRGWYISFSGPVTYKNARQPVEACALVPLDRLLIETDSPYLPPVPHRGEMNHPHYASLTCSKVAEIKGLSFEEMAKITFENAMKVYRLK